MKKALALYLLLACAAGCTRQKEIQFCEGISPKGEGVKCGTAFQDGDLTALVTSREPFAAPAITVRVYRETGSKKEMTESINMEVRPESERAAVNLSLYTGGRYTVRAYRKGTLIGEGDVEIIEQ